MDSVADTASASNKEHQGDSSTDQQPQSPPPPPSPPTATATATEEPVSETAPDAAPANTGASQSGGYVPPPMDTAPPSQPPQRKRSDHQPMLTADVDINSCDNRQTLAKSSTHRTIIEATGAEVSTKGRYYAHPEDATPDDPALHLHLEASTQESLDQAIEMIEQLKSAEAPNDAANGDSQWPASAGNGDHPSYPRHYSRPGSAAGSLSGSSSKLQDKVFVDIESERGFNVRAKLIGTGGENMKYIQSTTGARVQVRGRGSGYNDSNMSADSLEPMHLFVTASSEEALAQAKGYCQSLIDTIHAQYREFREGGSGGGRRRDHHQSRRADSRDSHDYHSADHYHSSSRHEPYPSSRSHQSSYSRQHSGYSRRSERHQGRNSASASAPYYESPVSSAYGGYQNYASSQYPGSESAAVDPQSAPVTAGASNTTAADAAAYEEYANYCAQYYQYYGTYPDYSAYYSQATANDVSSAQQQDPLLSANSTVVEAPEDTHTKSIDKRVSGNGGLSPQNGYHNVPPPANYASGGNNQKV
ncbi:hypothetical protein GGI07_000054 [Coemansia sp. Benny D115]|nr:hypothetical protein GGI07_000054 [Coemansia sp. Benny D115]